jgi:cephalosporin hydroxylase
MNEFEEFKDSCKKEIVELGADQEVSSLTLEWLNSVNPHKYSYHFSSLGRPIIQYPQDMVAVQELIWEVKPDLIIETGIAHGGSLIMSASCLALLDICDAINEGSVLNPRDSKRMVLGLDIDIREHNRTAIVNHPMSSRIKMIEGSSVAPEIVKQVHEVAAKYSRIMVMLDSNHTHDHVLAELEAYGNLTSVGSYLCVFDTVIEDLPKSHFPNRSWGPGDNPKTAVWEYLKTHPEFEIDRTIQNKLQITVAPDGYLRRVEMSDE